MSFFSAQTAQSTKYLSETDLLAEPHTSNFNHIKSLNPYIGLSYAAAVFKLVVFLTYRDPKASMIPNTVCPAELQKEVCTMMCNM